MQRVFISGPVSGIENYNASAFLDAQERLEHLGYQVLNPFWICEDIREQARTRYANDPALIWDACMERLIPMLKKCNAIYMLNGWSYSDGAMIEYCYARHLGLRILTEEVD